MRPFLLAATAAMTRALGALFAVPALAQVAPVYPAPMHTPGAPVVSLHQYQMDQHRYRMDQLRHEADQRQALASQMALESRLRRDAVLASLAPEPDAGGTLPTAGTRPLYSPEVEAGLARGATSRRETVVSGVTQIDSWLDQTPH